MIIIDNNDNKHIIIIIIIELTIEHGDDDANMWRKSDTCYILYTRTHILHI